MADAKETLRRKRISDTMKRKGLMPITAGRVPKSAFKKGMTPWNKDKKGSQVAWNKGIKTGVKHDKQFKKGNIPWSKGKKLDYMAGENNTNWKGGVTEVRENVRKLSKYL